MSTPQDNRNERFEEQAKRAFDSSVEELDAATLSRLNRGRQAALAAAGRGRRARQWTLWAPAAGVTAAAVFAVVMLRGPLPDEIAVPPPVPGVTDFEIMVSEDKLEMIEELEFYSWLATMDDDAMDNVG